MHLPYLTLKNVVVSALLFFSIAVSAQHPENGYYFFKGDVGGIIASMRLHIGGGKVSGYCAIGVAAKPESLQGDLGSMPADSLIVSASTPRAYQSFIWRAKWNKDKLQGILWIEKEGKYTKVGPFQLNRKMDSTTVVKYTTLTREEKLPVKTQFNPACTFWGGTIIPEKAAGAAWEKMMWQTAHALIGNKNESVSPDKYLEAEAKKICAAWKQDYGKLSAKEADELGNSISSETQMNLLLMDETRQFISIACFNYAYTGGAHGNYATATRTIDKRNGKLLKLNDVVAPSGMMMLNKALDSALRKNLDLDPQKTLEQNGMLVKSMKPAENFYVADGGLGFMYAPYEVAPFS